MKADEPRLSDAGPPLSETTESQQVGLHVLVADDHQDHAETMMALLLGLSAVATVDVANDGLQAVRLARARPPDLAILDIEMPHLSGADTARAIQSSFNNRCPLLVAMTGNPDSAAASELSGVFAHILTKPIDFSHVASAIAAASLRSRTT